LPKYDYVDNTDKIDEL